MGGTDCAISAVVSEGVRTDIDKDTRMIGIRQKIMIGFGGLLAIIAVVGTLTMVQLGELGKASTSISSRELPQRGGLPGLEGISGAHR